MTDAASRHDRRLTREDILSVADYAAVRRERRARIALIKRRRRIEVGPFCDLPF